MDQYRCPQCGNTVPASRVDKRVPGSKNMVRVASTVICEKDSFQMEREAMPAARREVSPHR